MNDEHFSIKTEAEFQQLMESVDAGLRRENRAIAARPMLAWLRVSSRFDLGLSLPAPEREPREGSYAGDDLTIRCLRWFDQRYGHRLKIDPTWKMAIMLRGDVYRMRLPSVYGSVRAICSPRDFGCTRSNILGSQAEPPTVNILDLIDGLTEEYAKKLSDEELASILRCFQLGLTARNEIESVREINLVAEAIGDLQACVAHLFSDPAQYGLSKWASLEATEKIIKAFIGLKKGKFDKNHYLDKQATMAESLGLRAIPRVLLAKIQCSAGVRYGNPRVSLPEAVEAHHTALDVCLGVSNQIFLHRNYKPVMQLQPGKFYINGLLGRQYRCIEVDGDKARIMVFGELRGAPVDAVFVQDRKYWGQYFEIADTATTERLEKRYQFVMARK